MKFCREPLVHFLLLGTAIFVCYGLVAGDRGAKDGQIIIGQSKIEHLASTFARLWHRPPTEQELAGLIEDYLREEVFYREALALGLDRDDTVIRRRLRQKMEFIAADSAAPLEPSDDELRTYLQAHARTFAIEPRFTFRQVYLDPRRRGGHLSRDVARLLIELQQGQSTPDLAALGDSVLLAPEFENMSATEVRTLFGEPFVTALSTLPPGQWQGPVPSGYGVHLVYVIDRTQERTPELSEVREAVRREWANAQRIAANEAFYQRLQQRYTVTIEHRLPAAGEGSVAEARP
jgi:parvulin-like peptidyl-prolyl cis-trans isomerase-like protein